MCSVVCGTAVSMREMCSCCVSRLALELYRLQWYKPGIVCTVSVPLLGVLALQVAQEAGS